MTGAFQSLELFVLICFFLIVGSQTEKIPPPVNVTLQWITPFRPQLSWTPPDPTANCTYTYTCKVIETNDYNSDANVHSPWSTHLQLNNENWQLSVETVCDDGRHSDPYIVNISYPGIIEDLQCTIQSSKRARCSWLPVSGVQDLVFSYGLVNEDGSVSRPKERFPRLQPCSLNDTADGRTGCDLQANISQAIFISFNGTLENKPVRSTFKRFFEVRPPPLKWMVHKNEDKFDISWIPPDIGQLSEWNFIINYTECGTIKSIYKEGVTRTELKLVSHCQYCMSVQAQMQDGWAPWSEKKCFDADPNPLVFIAVVIPLMVAVLAVLAFVFFRKNKDSIFPEIPAPRDFLSDISDNNNKCNVRNLYVPAEEEEVCKITLVIEP